MHFWAGSTVEPDNITDIPAYNRANGIMWAVYAAVMVLSGLLGLFSITAGATVLVLACVPGVIILFIAYKRIYNKYKRHD